VWNIHDSSNVSCFSYHIWRSQSKRLLL
jgi:hypothetical protein